jgi:RecG-like helicase
MQSQEAVEAEELREESINAAASFIGSCPGGCAVTLAGVLRSLTIQPVGATPALEAELYDGTGSIDIIWMGRRAIAGIEAGRHILVTGRLTGGQGRHRMYNPKYTLRPAT